MPISPLVDRPQTKKLPASNQKRGTRDARPSARKALTIGLPFDGASGSISVPPKGAMPTAAGRSGMKNRMIGITASAAAATIRLAVRHPTLSLVWARIGRNTNCPLCTLAVRNPTARPRRWRNHCPAMVAANTLAMVPVAMPESRPQVSTSSQAEVTSVVEAEAKAISTSAPGTMRRKPKR